jgi:putative transposase
LGCDRRRSKLRLYRGNVTSVALYRGKYRVESNRLQSWDYATPGWYFVTICTANQVCSLGEVVEGVVRLSQIGEIAQFELDNISTHYATVRVDSSIVMPNHIHAIIVLEGAHQYTPGLPPAIDLGVTAANVKPGSLSAVVRSYKAGVVRSARQRGLEFGWQAGFYDHILRCNRSVNAVRDYIEKNPSSWDEDRENPKNHGRAQAETQQAASLQE